MPKLSTIADNIFRLGPYPEYSMLLNKYHFYQNSMLLHWAERNAHPVTLKHLANYGKTLNKDKIIMSANFVRNEIPVRLALRIKSLQKLPFDVVNNFHFAQVYECYYHCFNSFRKYSRIDNLEENDKFCEFIKETLDEHLTVLPHLMMGALENSILNSLPQKELDDFMSSMLRSRVSRRVILEEHISLTTRFQKNKSSDSLGDLFSECSAFEQLEICTGILKNYLRGLYPNLQLPELIIEGEDAKFPFMLSHLHFIFGEILRNSYKAVITNCLRINDHLGEEQLGEIKPPSIVVSVASNAKDVVFRFSDQGGGMPKEVLQDIWSFGKSPKKAQVYLNTFHSLPGLDLNPHFQVKDSFSGQHKKQPSLDGSANALLKNITHMEEIVTQRMGIQDKESQEGLYSRKKSFMRSLIARPFDLTLGVSLPMCKVYTDYWNGDLRMHSLEGYGSDTYLRLSKLGSFNSDKVQLDRA
ncbi:BA75_00381T0 [Komagataella pastoris]|uniref:Protein-serine/threonine kinase n=1 Tax=Komagataella pastoris TaxID=4922 RepID=A0A1B2J9A2_PICPA|nr:BA75_00381T0 [Komagataella pastoris]